MGAGEILTARASGVRCPGCKSRRGEPLAGLRRCAACGLVFVPAGPTRYPRVPHRKTGRRVPKEED